MLFSPLQIEGQQLLQYLLAGEVVGPAVGVEDGTVQPAVGVVYSTICSMNECHKRSFLTL